MKINFHQLVSAVGSKKDKIAAGLLVLYAQAASAGDVQAFDKLYTQLTGWAQGSLGKSIAIIFLLVGLAVGLAKGSLYAAVVSIACGLTLMILKAEKYTKTFPKIGTIGSYAVCRVVAAGRR